MTTRLTSPVLLRAPLPDEGDTPTAYAQAAGEWHAAATGEKHKKDGGQYFTPGGVARFMAGLCRAEGHRLRVLDPGAGAGVLSCALCEALCARPDPPGSVELICFETDPVLAGLLRRTLDFARDWAARRGVNLAFEIRTEDFVLAHAGALQAGAGLFAEERQARPFYDVVISNPPYFKIPKSDARARMTAAVVHGQPNIYALFMAVAASLLRPGGELIFLTPRSFASGPYFRRFREHLFSLVRPLRVHVFRSRRDAFRRDEVLQENVILHAQRAGDGRGTDGVSVVVSDSAGVCDLADSGSRRVALSEVVGPMRGGAVLHLPVAEAQGAASRRVGRWPGSLQAHGLAISTGPVVPFRAAEHLSETGCGDAHAPLLWMQHVTAMRTRWPLSPFRKPQYISRAAEASRLLVPNVNYILLRRFSSKEQNRRLIAAPHLADCLPGPVLGLENHLNYIYRPGGSLSEAEAFGLAALLNGELLDAYFRTFNGNTQVSATEMRAAPLPALGQIREIGELILKDAMEAEAAVSSVLGGGSDGGADRGSDAED